MEIATPATLLPVRRQETIGFLGFLAEGLVEFATKPLFFFCFLVEGLVEVATPATRLAVRWHETIGFLGFLAEGLVEVATPATLLAVRCGHFTSG